jgi:uncharacterized RDD family membrane protein YckC
MEPPRALVPGRFSDRFIAYLLDTIPFTVGAVATVWVWGGPLQRSITNRSLLGIGAAWIGLSVLWQFAGNLGGATPGKQVMGLRIVTAEGEAPGAARAFVRAVAWLFSTPLGNFGFLVALFHPKTRALHDLIAGTFVVEAGPRRSNGAAAFLVAVLAAIGLFVLQYWTNLLRPTRDDLNAIAKAREGLQVIARIEDEAKARNGVYAGSAQELAQASGDVEVFRSAMLDVFRPTPFIVEAGNHRWRVTAAAKDRRRTIVRLEGP